MARGKARSRPRVGYRQIARSLDGRIRDGRLAPGDQLPTEMQLASQFAVNRFTVRRALAQLESDGKLLRHRGRGTFVAGPSTRGLSLLYLGELESHFNKDQFLALMARGQGRGHRVFGLDPRQTPPSELTHQLTQSDWAIVNAAYFTTVKPALAEARRKTVLIGPTPMEDDLITCAVLIDRFAATSLAVQHLHRLGHQRVALATIRFQLSEETDPPRVTNEAYLGFLDAAHRLDITRTIRVVRVHNNPGDKDIFLDVLRQGPADRPTAIVCDADFRARPLYEAAAELGLRIPEQLSVIGEGDTPWCEAMNPELSSMNFGEKQVAHLVVSLCESGATRQGLTCRVTPRLIERQSCAPPPEYQESGVRSQGSGVRGQG